MTRQISFRLENQDQSWEFIESPTQVVVSKKTILPVFFSTSVQSQGIFFKFSQQADPRRSFENSESVKMFLAASMCFSSETNRSFLLVNPCTLSHVIFFQISVLFGKMLRCSHVISKFEVSLVFQSWRLSTYPPQVRPYDQGLLTIGFP